MSPSTRLSALPQPVAAATIGGAWIEAMRAILSSGTQVDDFLEILDLAFLVTDAGRPDAILDRLADPANVAEMRKVFFGGGASRFGHSYREAMRGPGPGDPLESAAEILAAKPSSRKAVVSLVGSGHDDVPCVCAIHFLVRGDRLHATYFARGQDMFNKFYADALCVVEMAERVRGRLGLAGVALAGCIGSAHVYVADVPRAREILAAAGGP